jgi:hypothetical protein
MIGVSASALALHLDCSRTYIAKREADGVIQRQGDGFLLAQRTRRNDDVEALHATNQPDGKISISPVQPC